MYLSIYYHLSVCVHVDNNKKLKLKDKTLENIKLYLTTKRLIYKPCSQVRKKKRHTTEEKWTRDMNG